MGNDMGTVDVSDPHICWADVLCLLDTAGQVSVVDSWLLAIAAGNATSSSATAGLAVKRIFDKFRHVYDGYYTSRETRTPRWHQLGRLRCAILTGDVSLLGHLLGAEEVERLLPDREVGETENHAGVSFVENALLDIPLRFCLPHFASADMFEFLLERGVKFGGRWPLLRDLPSAGDALVRLYERGVDLAPVDVVAGLLRAFELSMARVSTWEVETALRQMSKICPGMDTFLAHAILEAVTAFLAAKPADDTDLGERLHHALQVLENLGCRKRTLALVEGASHSIIHEIESTGTPPTTVPNLAFHIIT